jgi:hypothetical protein
VTFRDWLGIAGTAISLAGFLVVLNRGRAAALEKVADGLATLGRDTNRRLDAMVRDMTARAVALETKVEVFWRTVTVQAAAVLHSPHPEHARRDVLLEALMVGRLGIRDAAELADLVQPVLDDPEVTAAERLAAANVLGYLAAMFGQDQPGTS